MALRVQMCGDSHMGAVAAAEEIWDIWGEQSEGKTTNVAKREQRP